MHIIDDFLNRITMYRLTMLGLGALAIVSILAAFFQTLPFTALQLTLSLALLLIACRVSNAAFAILFKADATKESSYITALILFFVFSPLQSVHDALLLVLFGCVAMLSKYVIATNKKHIFNPAAFAAFVASVFGTGLALWWVATPVLFPFVLVLGLLLVRKIRRFDLFWAFVLAAVGVYAIRVVLAGTPILSALLQFVMSWPLIYFGSTMVTEPQTTPPTRTDRIVYGAIVGLFFSLSFTLGPVSATPELALLIGNLYAYAVSFRRRVSLKLKEIEPLTRDIFEFVFVPDRAFAFSPGQYLEWTVPHNKSDKRSVRRYFTISSAPEDPFVRVGMRVPVEGSSFKKTLSALPKGAHITATSLSGSFTLPKDPNQKIAAIAGGIGITPFMSMFRHLAERHERRDIVLIYAANSPLDFAYQKELDEMASSIGLKIVYLPREYTELTSWTGKSGFITSELIREDIPDFASRMWYLSGPQGMVSNYKTLLQNLHIAEGHIKTDYFPGL